MSKISKSSIIYNDRSQDFINIYHDIFSCYGLIPSEISILPFIESEFSNKEIAKFLSIDDSTVSNRLSSIFQKLFVSNRKELKHLILYKKNAYECSILMTIANRLS
jgi:DNA-binding NarL/FixJ family response regulator